MTLTCRTASGVARHGAWPSAYGRWHPRPMMGRVDPALSLVGSFVFPGARARRLPLPRTHSPLPRTHFSLPRTHSLYQDAPLAPGHRTLSLHSLCASFLPWFHSFFFLPRANFLGLITEGPSASLPKKRRAGRGGGLRTHVLPLALPPRVHLAPPARGGALFPRPVQVNIYKQPVRLTTVPPAVRA